MCALFATYVSRVIRPVSDVIQAEIEQQKKDKKAKRSTRHRSIFSDDVGGACMEQLDQEAYRSTVQRFELNFQRQYKALVRLLHSLPRNTLDHCVANLIIKLTALNEHMKE